MDSLHITVIIFLIIFSYQLIFAQNNLPASNGPIPKMKSEQNYAQTPSEKFKVFGTAYGHSSLQNYTLSMPLPAGTPFTFLQFWAAPVFASSMTQMRFLPHNYYITDIGPPPRLFEMNPENGVVTLVGIINGMDPYEQVNGISYNPWDNTFYLISSTTLYSFDPSSLTATLIGPLNTGGLMIDLCFDAYGNCYAYDIETDSAYTVNITTGNATPLGPLGYDANYGQGMGYDFESSTIYLSAFNNSTFSGQLRTMDPATGMTTLITDWGYEQIAPFAPPTMPCMSPVGQASNPNPPSDATNIPIAGVTLSWINGVFTINVEVWFGVQGNVVKVYDGPAITSWDLDTLLYSTQYRWYILCKDTICGGTPGPSWIFTTENAAGIVFIEPFNDLSNWTSIGPLGQANWSNPQTNCAGGTAPELMCSYLPSYDGLNQLISLLINTVAGHNHEFKFRYMYDWFADPAPAHGLAITYDGGAISTSLWEQTPVGGNTGPDEIVIQYFPAADTFQLIIYNNGNSFNMNYIYYDDIVVTDLELIPVELSSFFAVVDNNAVTLLWQTATEKNNQGFEILISAQNDKNGWKKIGFVPGHGTTAETQNYSFTYNCIAAGKYQFRLIQIDFDGTFKYSPKIEVEVLIPLVFSLEQNYPNPFNPATIITYSVPHSSQVQIKVYNILGKEIETLVNEEKQSGTYELTWNAANLSSGVYFYQLRAGSYLQTKKMILLR